jgi:molecular chaperone Hsp33
MQDQLHRFVFDHTPVRGNTVQLQHAFNSALQHQQYPVPLRKALGELMAASALLIATLKMQGALVLQIQGKGPVKLLVVECTITDNQSLQLRATAKWSGELPESDFVEMIGDGHFAITLDPKDGSQPYQGIVPLAGDSVSHILENYMQRSEQIETRIWLACDGQSAAGLLLQKLPESWVEKRGEQDEDAWDRTGMLADTVTADELLALPAEDLLHRLFHEEELRLFEGQGVAFNCSCSQRSVGNMLRMLGREEIDDIIAERGEVEVHCDFCNAAYRFDKVDISQLFTEEISAPGSPSHH